MKERTSMPRRTMVLFFLVDASSSMEGVKIGAVNDAIRNVLPMVSDISENDPDSDVKVAVLKFSSGVEWVYSEPKLANEFEWLDVQADGLTNLGEACKELNNKLSRSQFMSTPGGYYQPALIILSDGQPTDDFMSGLAKLKQNKWYQHSIKAAIAIGNDADKGVLAEFCSNKECVIDVHNIESLKRVIRLLAVTSSTIGLYSRLSDDGGKQQMVIDSVKEQIQKEQEQAPDTSSLGDTGSSAPEYIWEDWD